MLSKLFVSGVVLCMLSACATTGNLYYWGEYEPTLKTQYQQPNEMPPSLQVIKLEQAITKANSNGAQVAPGIYAHLGVAYADLGRDADAQAAFAMEQKLYPESSHWINTMLERAKNQNSVQGGQTL